MVNLYSIKIDDGIPFGCREDMTVMRAMCKKHISPVHYGCCGGGCGICKMQILSGEYKVVSRMSRQHVSKDEEAIGIVLLCCVQPRSNLIIKKFKEENQWLLLKRSDPD